MQPINSKYIYLFDSRLTLITTPWYKVIDKQEAGAIKWQEAALVTGCHLKELGVKIKDSDICKFFDVTTDLILFNAIKKFCPIYCLQALISVSVDSTLNPSKKYTFIRPTKTGSTAIKKYFNEHYKEYITVEDSHQLRCSNSNNPIIVVRDVKSRFISMYKFWKNLSENTTKRRLHFIEKHKDITILDFINIIKTDKEYLLKHDKWIYMLDNTSAWIGNTDYKNIIIIKYQEDLNESIQRLINLLGIENKNKPVEKINISGTDNIKEELLNHPDVDDFIKEYFKDDIILIDAIENTPELFKAVI